MQARSESLLALISGLALVGTLLVARRFRLDGTIRRVGWLVGPLLGLALATKLTAALAIVAVCAYGGVVALARLRTSRPEAIRMLVWAFTTGAAATVVWVTVNPFLWADPVGRTWSMLEQQQSIMVEQGAQFGNPVDVGFPQRVGLLVYRTFVENSTPAFDSGRPPGSEPLHRRTFSELPALFGLASSCCWPRSGSRRWWRARSAPGWPASARAPRRRCSGGLASMRWGSPRTSVWTGRATTSQPRSTARLLIGLGADAAVAAARYAWAGPRANRSRRSGRPTGADWRAARAFDSSVTSRRVPRRSGANQRARAGGRSRPAIVAFFIWQSFYDHAADFKSFYSAGYAVRDRDAPLYDLVALEENPFGEVFKLPPTAAVYLVPASFGTVQQARLAGGCAWWHRSWRRTPCWRVPSG